MRQSISPRKLECLFSIISKRDMNDSVRQAVRRRIINGYSFELAALDGFVRKSTVINAVKRLEEMDRKISEIYSHCDCE